MAALRREVVVTYEPRGGARALFGCRAPEIILSGPAGTGKSRACLEKLHLAALKYPRMHALAVRKTLNSLTGTGLVTYREKVLHPLDGVTFFSGNKQEPAQYRYPNGSRLMVGGLDNTAKIMSGEYDMIYVQEATEVSEPAWEELTTRLRYGVMPYQQLIGDCNPGAPSHWIKQRANRGLARLLESRHEDNPTVTPEYLATLDRLTGVRYQRLRLGKWAAAEGMVYEGYDRAIHVVDRFAIPPHWRRVRSIDFGYTNPFVCQWWAIDHDGVMYLYRELYQTRRLTEDHARQIVALSAGERIEATVADHDAEDRATLARYGIDTIPAYKAISVGIQAMARRLSPAGNGAPRLFLMQDSLIQQDDVLIEQHKPLCSEQEIDGYVWPKGQDGKAIKEVPLDMDNHGMDAARYAVAYVDGLGAGNLEPLAPELSASLAGFTGL